MSRAKEGTRATAATKGTRKKKATKAAATETTGPAFASERSLVRRFIDDLQRATPAYIFIDQDSQARYTKSGFDFLVSAGGRAIFVEAKVATDDREALRKLSPFQRATLARVLASRGTYVVLVFPPQVVNPKRPAVVARALEAVGPDQFDGHSDARAVFLRAIGAALADAGNDTGGAIDTSAPT